jgi:hypothetical protein
MTNKNRKGDVSSKALIGIIFLIISFAIILFFLFRLNLGKETEQEVCHNSVITKSSVIGASNLLKDTIPLNCRTQTICITQDGTCEKLTSPEIKKVKDKNEVYNVLATQLTNCWWMFGEGKVDYVGKELLTNNVYCSLCSQIAFDDSVDTFDTEEFPRQMDKLEFYQYLSQTKMPESDNTYWDYLYLVGSPEGALDFIKLNSTNPNQRLGTINLDKISYIVMGITSKTSSLYSLSKLGTLVRFILDGNKESYLGQVVEGESGKQYLSPTIIEANSADFELLKCKDINTII